MEQNIVIKTMLERSMDIDDLVSQIKSFGPEFESDKKLIRFIYEQWQNSNKSEIDKIDKEAPTEITELPYTETKVLGNTYRIHGICHGVPPFLKPRSKTKKLVEANFRKYTRSKLEDCFLEEGLSDLFGLDKSKELSKSMENAMHSFGLKGQLDIGFKVLKGAALTNIFFPFYLLSKNNMNYFLKSIFDPKYLVEGRKMYNLCAKIPEPFNIDLKQNYGGTMEKFVVRYSQEMTKGLLARSKGKKNTTIHAFVGFEHESEITYYLNNPDKITSYSHWW
jgi:hypothetical protein